MLGVVVTVLLALHLISMNVVAAAPVVSIWLDRRARKDDTEAQSAVRRLMIVCCALVPIGALLGVALGWLFWNEQYQAIVYQFNYRVQWGIIEYLFSAAVIAVYTAWLFWKPRASTAAWWTRSLLAVVTATNLFYHFPPLFSAIAGTASGHIQVEQHVDSATFRRLLMDGEVMALSVHFAIASFAVTGALLAVIARASTRPETNYPGADAHRLATVRETNSPGADAHRLATVPGSAINRTAITGGRLALASTLCQIPTGFWLMMQIPDRDQRRLLGEDLATAGLFIAALIISFWLLHLLAAISFGDTSRKTIWRAAAVLFTVVVLMTGTLQRGQRHESPTELFEKRSSTWLSSAQPLLIPAPEQPPKSL